ncbi:Sorting nexin mvp1, partial [Ascosphaera pollenicola]
MDNTRPSPVVAPHLHSQSHSSESGMSTPAKRKFDAPHPPSADENVALTQNPATKEKLDAHLRELLSLLIKYDDDVDVLKTPLPAGNEPNSKRPRLGHGLPDGQDQLTIESKVLSGRYDSFQSFVTDLDAASTAVTDNRRAQDNAGTTPQPGRPSLQDVINRTRILRKHVDNYMLRNPFRDDNVVTSTTAPAAGTTIGAASPETSATATPVPNGATASGSETQPLEEVHAREDKTILTVFGNAPRGKQLFSSLRKSDAGKQAGKIKEEDLPPGITVSKVIPFNPDLDQSETSKKRTFAEVFTPKVTLPPLDPPPYPPARPSAVPWIDPYEAAVNARIRPEERTGFLYYPVPSGRWLQYGYEDVVRNTLKKTQTQLTPAQAATRGSRLRRGPFARHLREEDPLFANVYSSFAPSYESAGALVGREVRERIWWETAGVRKMVEALQLGQDDETEGEKNDKKEKKGVGLEMIDEALLQEAIDTYEEPKLPEEKEVKNAEEKELDGIF